MITHNEEALQFYAQPAPITRLEGHDEFLNWLVDDVRAITQVIQGLLIHGGWLENYACHPDPARDQITVMAYMQDLLDEALRLDGRNLAIARAPEQRVICCCREFSTLLTAILRFKGVPARSRCGFATYFAYPGKYEDHWVCEYWDAPAGRWWRVDPQIDPFQQSFVHTDFSPLEVPANRFINGGQAWQMSRTGGVAPTSFGIYGDPAVVGLDSLYGLWFTRGNLLRDFAALNKVETVPFLVRAEAKLSWQPWRLVAASDEELTASDWALLDRVAELCASADDCFEQVRALYESTPDLQPPDEIIERKGFHWSTLTPPSNALPAA